MNGHIKTQLKTVCAGCCTSIGWNGEGGGGGGAREETD